MRNYIMRCKEAWQVARLVMQLRKSGITCELAIVDEDELLDNRHWLAQRDYENQLMQACICDIMDYKTPCTYCEENAECKREQHGKRGCRDWWLRFLTEEEIQACAARAADDEEVDDEENGAEAAENEENSATDE